MKESYRFGLIGSNIGYSRSPAVFDAIFDEDGVEGRFELYDLAPESFDNDFDHLVERGVQGLSVTIPFKQRVIDKLDELDPAAEALEAVNSIALGDVRRGFNTDVYGFAYSLTTFADVLDGGRALVFGCGGGARAAVFSLVNDYAVAEVLLLGRALESLTRCRHDLEAALPEVKLSARLVSDFDAHAHGSFAITVNATPLGGWNHPDQSPLPDRFDWARAGLYYDLNYNDTNPIVQSARAAGIAAFDGSRMLIAQAVRSYGLWTGREVAFEPVYKRIFNR